MLQGNPPTFEPSAGELLAYEPGQTTLLFGLENDALMPMEKAFSPEGLQPENSGDTLDMVSRGCSRASNPRGFDSTHFSEAVNRAEGTSTIFAPEIVGPVLSEVILVAQTILQGSTAADSDIHLPGVGDGHLEVRDKNPEISP